MSIGALDAALAYGRTLQTAGTKPSTPQPPVADAGAAGGNFGAMVQDMVSEASTNLKAAEAATAQQVAGKGDLIDVVTAIGAAEMALDTVTAVRDRVVSAYSEIMRMQI